MKISKLSLVLALAGATALPADANPMMAVPLHYTCADYNSISNFGNPLEKEELNQDIARQVGSMDDLVKYLNLSPFPQDKREEMNKSLAFGLGYRCSLPQFSREPLALTIAYLWIELHSHAQNDMVSKDEAYQAAASWARLAPQQDIW